MARSILALVVRRLILAVPVLIGETLLVFSITILSPASPAFARLGKASPETYREVRAELGLNDPIHERYLDWIADIVLRGDLGTSLVSQKPIAPELIDRLAVSGELALFGVVWMVLLAGGLGLISAFNRNRLPDHVARTYAILGISIPDFVVGLFLILVFGVWLGWLPAGGWVPITESIVGNLKHIILPSYTVGFLFTAIMMRMFRSDILETMNSEHVTAAKAMGISKRKKVVQDIVKPAVIPTLTTLGMTIGVMIGGLVLAEIVFAIPGLGRYTVRSLFNGDYPVVSAALLIIAAIFTLANIIVDIAYYYLDPRIRVRES